jgi:hypothetical protein
MSTDKASVDAQIERLIQIESHVHYGEPPPPDVPPFVFIEHDSSVLVSAPHGTRTFRNNTAEKWHEEDEFTASMALLLAEQCGVSAIANIWRDDAHDPNFNGECKYKEILKRIVSAKNVRFVLDLHGAREDSDKLGAALVDLGTRKDNHSLEVKHRDVLATKLRTNFGDQAVSFDGFPADKLETITGYCQATLRIQAVQIEMKPSVRVPVRRTDASVYAKLGAYSAPPGNVWKVLGVLADFVRYLQSQ